MPPGPEEGFDINSMERPLERMLELHARYGDVYRVHSPERRRWSYVIAHPRDVKHVLIDNRNNYHKGTGFDRVRILLGNNIITSDGEIWRRNRLMVQPAFHRDLIETYARRMEPVNAALARRWLEHAARGEPVDVTRDTSELALLGVLGALFSDDVERFDEDGGNPFMLVAEESARDLAFARRFRELGRQVQALIERRRAQGIERSDVLGALMLARDRKTGEPMADKQIVSEVLMLVVAGHETTATTLNFTWYLLSCNPRVAAALEQEIGDVLGSRPATVDDLPRLAYTRQALEETMRLYPPVWRFTRRAVADDEIGGYSVPAGSDVCICPYITHRHAEFWPDAESYRPERFAEEEVERRHRVAYLPFSAGPRRCIGDSLALIEMQLHLAHVVPALRLRATSDEAPELEPEVNLRTRGSIHMLAEAR
ncbi:MAG: cytochrome P450 [Gammaproteobacteria bacterium]|nr:cytochrome P450 [Gammaproteobacteria bacterium]